MAIGGAAIVFAVAALAATVVAAPVCAFLRRVGVVDTPNARSSHKVPTVRGGGVAIVAVIAGFLTMLSCGPVSRIYTPGGSRLVTIMPDAPGLGIALLLGTFLALAAVSFVDDLKGVPARVRFAVHAVCAVGAVLIVANRPYQVGITAITFAIIGVIWIAAYTNAFNFMDGINGIAATQAIATGLGTAAIAQAAAGDRAHAAVMVSVVIAGAAIGFLPHNFPRARVFMGDVSSAPLGFLLAVLALWIAQLTSWWLLFWVALLHANFVLDTGITLVRRALRGDRLSEAHREHFYQRLVRAGWSHTRVTLTEFGLQVLAAVALWLATPASPQIRLAVAVGVIAVWLGLFGFAEWIFRKATRAAATGASGPAKS